MGKEPIWPDNEESLLDFQKKKERKKYIEDLEDAARRSDDVEITEALCNIIKALKEGNTVTAVLLAEYHQYKPQQLTELRRIFDVLPFGNS